METNLKGFKLICKVNIHFVLKKYFLKIKVKLNLYVHTFKEQLVNSISGVYLEFKRQSQFRIEVHNTDSYKTETSENYPMALEFSVLEQGRWFKATLPQKVRSFSETAPNRQPADDIGLL